ncbi:hypothetical protein M885DRAFT_296977 [Pelagophyceae sp. CCMP2097]|nr:hypothetical protein M885DRAFT_296977 [Pelagophyceae sp. CCMP2097]
MQKSALGRPCVTPFAVRLWASAWSRRRCAIWAPPLDDESRNRFRRLAAARSPDNVDYPNSFGDPAIDDRDAFLDGEAYDEDDNACEAQVPTFRRDLSPMLSLDEVRLKIAESAALDALLESARADRDLAADVLDAMISAALRLLHEFKPLELANLAWSVAVLRLPRPHFFRALDAFLNVDGALDGFGPRDLSKIAWSFSRVDYPPQLFFEVLAVAAEKAMPDFDAESVAQTAWAFARTSTARPSLYEALAINAITEMEHFRAEHLALTALSFANHVEAFPDDVVSNTVFFERAASAAVLRLGDFDALGLTHLASAFSKTSRQKSASHKLDGGDAGYYDENLFAALAAHVCDPRNETHVSRFEPPGLFSLVQSFADARCRHDGLFRAVSETLLDRGALEQLRPVQLAKLASYFARLDYSFDCFPAFFASIENQIALQLPVVNSAERLTAAWAFCALGGAARPVVYKLRPSGRNALDLDRWPVGKLARLNDLRIHLALTEPQREPTRASTAPRRFLDGSWTIRCDPTRSESDPSPYKRRSFCNTTPLRAPEYAGAPRVAQAGPLAYAAGDGVVRPPREAGPRRARHVQVRES